ncbi:EEF1A lysine methyltransferase 3 [Aegotheles albertisi]
MAAPGVHVGAGARREAAAGGDGAGEEEWAWEEEEEEEEEGAAGAALRAVFPRDPALFAEAFPVRRRYRLCGRVLRIAEHHGPRLGLAACVWEAALSLCRFLAQAPPVPLRGCSVIELGAGTGIVGIFAAMLGAEVTITDRPPALPQIRENVGLNFPGGVGGPRVQALEWGQGEGAFPREGFELVLGSDLLYHPPSLGPLLGVLRHLRAPRALLSTRRRGGDGAHGFLHHLLPPHFHVRLLRREPERDIEIYGVTPRGGGPGGH